MSVSRNKRGERSAIAKKRDEATRRDGSSRATVSDTCLRMVRRVVRCCGAAPYRACNMHVSIRTLSNISFRSIYPNALSRAVGSRCELYSISCFPPLCRRRARHKQARRCEKASFPRTYRVTMTRKKQRGNDRPDKAGSGYRLILSAPGLHPHLELSTGTFDARSCAPCSI